MIAERRIAPAINRSCRTPLRIAVRHAQLHGRYNQRLYLYPAAKLSAPPRRSRGNLPLAAISCANHGSPQLNCNARVAPRQKGSQLMFAWERCHPSDGGASEELALLGHVYARVLTPELASTMSPTKIPEDTEMKLAGRRAAPAFPAGHGYCKLLRVWVAVVLSSHFSLFGESLVCPPASRCWAARMPPSQVLPDEIRTSMWA